jgi:predicted transcriptional regulator
LVQHLAQNSEQTLSDVIRTAITDFLAKNSQTQNANKTPLLSQLAEIGQGVTGPNDLSTTYKQHLYQK